MKILVFFLSVLLFNIAAEAHIMDNNISAQRDTAKIVEFDYSFEGDLNALQLNDSIIALTRRLTPNTQWMLPVPTMLKNIKLSKNDIVIVEITGSFSKGPAGSANARPASISYWWSLPKKEVTICFDDSSISLFPYSEQNSSTYYELKNRLEHLKQTPDRKKQEILMLISLSNSNIIHIEGLCRY